MISQRNMGEGEYKHLVVVKFKDGVVVEDLIKAMEKMVSEIDIVKSFEWYVVIKNHVYCVSLCLVYKYFRVLC